MITELTNWRIGRTKNHGYPYLVGCVGDRIINTSPIVEVLTDGMCRTKNTTYRLVGHTNELEYVRFILRDGAQ